MADANAMAPSSPPLHPPLWRDRQEAGRALAQRCADQRNQAASTTLIGLPRGGVPVAAVMAAELRLPLATWAVRKVVDPALPEVAIGAVAAGGVVVWREGPQGTLAALARRRGWLATAERELQRRQQRFADPTPTQLEGRHLIVVDDGIATGMSVRAALESLRRTRPASLTLAVPVVDTGVAFELRRLVDRLEALATVPQLQAVGLWYERFDQLDDEAVLALLEAARCR